MTSGVGIIPGSDGGSSVFDPPEWGDADAMLSLSAQMVALTENYVAQIQATAATIFPPVINPNFPTITAPPVPVTVALPPLIDVAWDTPGSPSPFTGVLTINDIMPGPFTGVAPTLNFGAAPASFSGTVPPAPSINTDFVYPTIAPISLPNAPTLLSIDQVNFDPIAIPSFNVSVPTLVISSPNPFSYVEKRFYTSTELTTVQTSLISAMTDGTDTGLDVKTQSNLFDAGYEREYRAQRNALDELDRMEALGYAFPPGSFIDARIKIQTDTNATISGLSRDIMVKQAELHLENVMKSRELAITLEGKLIDYYNQTAQRAFDAAKYAVESSVAIYNAQVEMYKGQLEGFRVQAEVYDTQIKGIMAQVEEMKAQIAYEQTKAEINKSVVDAYSAQINASLAILKVYEVEVEIIKTEAEVEKLKIDTFNGQIQAFVGTVNAYTAQVEGYKASIEAQATVESAYKTSVDAYAAEVDAAAKVMDVQIAEYRAQIEAYTAQLDAYKAQLQAMVEQARAASLYNQSEVDVYKGEVAAVQAYNETLTAQWTAVLNEQEKIAEVGVKAAEANGQLYIAARQLSLDASKTAAQVAAQLGAAALNAIHWNNSSSWALSQSSSASTSISTATTTSTSNSTSNSTSDSKSDNTNTNLSA